MTQYNMLNVKLSIWQLNNLKFGLKNGLAVTLNISSKLTENSNGETNFLYELVLTDAQVSKIRKVFAKI